MAAIVEALPGLAKRNGGSTMDLRRWLFDSRWLFSVSERAELFQIVSQLEGEPGMRRSLLRYAEILKLRAEPKNVRIAAYRDAIRGGSAELPGGAEVLRLDAMRWAAEEGLEELEGELREHAGEFDTPGGNPAYYFLLLELRKGAADLYDARRRELQFYRSLGPEAARRLRHDRTLRDAFLWAAKNSCEGQDAEGCAAARSILEGVLSTPDAERSEEQDRTEGVLREAYGSLSKWRNQR